LMFVLWGVVFFEAEAGIGDWSVTGVQTCALPISPILSTGLIAIEQHQVFQDVAHARGGPLRYRSDALQAYPRRARAAASGVIDRSEERRVGKQCRHRESREDQPDMPEMTSDQRER